MCQLYIHNMNFSCIIFSHTCLHLFIYLFARVGQLTICYTCRDFYNQPNLRERPWNSNLQGVQMLYKNNLLINVHLCTEAATCLKFCMMLHKANDVLVHICLLNAMSASINSLLGLLHSRYSFGLRKSFNDKRWGNVLHRFQGKNYTLILSDLCLHDAPLCLRV